VGRPNVGKSTLVNALYGQERMITGPEAGLTRDAISVYFETKGRSVRLFDTAGLRRQAKIRDSVEKLSASDSLRAIRFAQVVVLVVDPDELLDKQDLTIARRVIDEGRALVIAVNKWDEVNEHNAVIQKLKDRLMKSLPQARGVPTLTISALHKRNLDKLMMTVFDLFETWSTHIGTSLLNRWLQERVELHTPPLVNGRRIKIRYINQAKIRPPTFVLFGNQLADLPDSYTRYLINGLRDDFGLDGVPIRFILRKGKNPYSGRVN
jgi:GTP-binding protein